MASLWDTVAGVGDHLAGDVDESIARQFDDRPGGGFFDLAAEGDPPADWEGQGDDGRFYNRFLKGDTARSVYDTIFPYEGTLNDREDTVDLPGAGLFEFARNPADATTKTVGDFFTTATTGWDYGGDNPDAESRGRIVIWLVVAAVALYLLAPLLELGAAVAE